jgi:hypothetical protein
MMPTTVPTAEQSLRTPGQQRSGWALWIAFAALFLFDVVRRVGCLGTGPQLSGYDDIDYWLKAGYLVHGDWQEWNSAVITRTPGYLALIALFRWLFGAHGLLALFAVQHLLGIATSLMAAATTYAITRNRWGALLTYALSTTALGLCLYGNKIMTEVPFTFLLVLEFALLVWGYRRGDLRILAACGLAAGCCTLVRPVAELLIVPQVCCLLLFTGWPVRRRIGTATVISVACLATVGPWCVRNALAYHTRPFLTHLLGRAIWIVCFVPGYGPYEPTLDPEAEQRVEAIIQHDGIHHPFHYTQLLCEQLMAKGYNECDADQLMADACKERIRQSPGPYLAGCLKRLGGYFWNGAYFAVHNSPDQALAQLNADTLPSWRWPVAAEAFESLSRWVYRPRLRSWGDRLYLVSFFVLSLLALGKPESRWIVLIVATVLYFAVVTVAVNEPEYRYRMVTEPLMDCGIGVGVSLLLMPDKKRFVYQPEA